MGEREREREGDRTIESKAGAAVAAAAAAIVVAGSDLLFFLRGGRATGCSSSS